MIVIYLDYSFVFSTIHESHCHFTSTIVNPNHTVHVSENDFEMRKFAITCKSNCVKLKYTQLGECSSSQYINYINPKKLKLS